MGTFYDAIKLETGCKPVPYGWMFAQWLSLTTLGIEAVSQYITHVIPDEPAEVIQVNTRRVRSGIQEIEFISAFSGSRLVPCFAGLGRDDV